ncbi:MAG: hypothetical protein WB491_00430 [Candidatus Aquilonibacter sp.]
MAEEHLRCYEDMNKGRFESFTDGVFAFPSVTREQIGRTVVAYRVGWFTYVGPTKPHDAAEGSEHRTCDRPKVGRIVYIPHGVDADVR